MRTPYRISQLWNVYFATPSDTDLAQVQGILSPQLMRLFASMHPGEQAHSVQICKQLLVDGEMNKDLLVAALLHDVGKSRYRIKPWERIMIVIGNWLTPQQAKRWGEGRPSGWKRPFVIAQKHAAWGAEMAAEAGASALTVNIIYRHQDIIPKRVSLKASTLEDQLLRRLQILDNTN